MDKNFKSHSYSLGAILFVAVFAGSFLLNTSLMEQKLSKQVAQYQPKETATLAMAQEPPATEIATVFEAMTGMEVGQEEGEAGICKYVHEFEEDEFDFRKIACPGFSDESTQMCIYANCDGFFDCLQMVQECVLFNQEPELPEAENNCDDGVDNDGNGLVDCKDESCQFESPLICGPFEDVLVWCADNLDNDGDGLLDCYDSDCCVSIECFDAAACQ